MARLARVAGKGLGVVAARDLGPYTFVCAYPGARMSRREFDRRAEAGATTGRYAVAHYAAAARGSIDFDHVVDPGISRGRLSARHAAALGPRVNEPSCGGAPPNLVWVWNAASGDVELWTGARGVRRGAELTACYGTAGGYRRAYCTPCAAPGVEPPLHLVLRAGEAPRPYDAAGGEPALRAALVTASRRPPCRGGTGSASSCTWGTATGHRGRSTCTRRT